MTEIKINTSQTKGYIHPELQGQFIEFLGSCIYDGIWVGEDSVIENEKGFRKDVLDGFRELQPPVIRWPGGCYADRYHWRNGIGPRDRRPVTYNENFGTCTVDSNQFGTHEFLEFCKIVGAKPWLNVNMMTGTPDEMREWMEYCNRQEETTLSMERARNGSPEPFEVKFWGIGNEAWDGGGKFTPQGYADKYRQFASAIPVFHSYKTGHESEKIYKIACGPDGNKPKERIAWTKDLFQSLQNYRQPGIDAVDLHFYNWNVDNPDETEVEFTQKDWYRVIRNCMELENVIKEQKQLIDEGICSFKKPETIVEDFYEAPKCDLIVGEWGNWHQTAFKSNPALFQQCTMRDAITTALTLDILHKEAGNVKMACVAQSVNVLNSLFLTDGDKFLKTPNFDVFKMYRIHRGGEILDMRMQEEADSDIYTFASIKDGIVALNVVNIHMSEEKSVSVQITGETDDEYICSHAVVLHAEEVHDHNTFEHPDMVRMRETEIPVSENGQFLITVPAASVSVYTFKKYNL